MTFSDCNLDFKVVAADSIRDSIRTEISDSQVSKKLRTLLVCLYF